MIQVRLPDGAIKEVSKGTTPLEIATSISEGLARNIMSASYNGEVVEATTPLQVDGSLILYTWNDPEGKKACLLYTSPSPRDVEESRMPSSA